MLSQISTETLVSVVTLSGGIHHPVMTPVKVETNVVPSVPPLAFVVNRSQILGNY
jgi:hypothetical protein